jgi:hypothetical protein
MTDTETSSSSSPDPTIDPSIDPSIGAPTAWKRILRRTGLVYLFSRLCVLLGAAIVAAELGADALKQKADFPNAPFADPNYADKLIPKSALRPMLDVLTSWDGAWYLKIIEHGYPRHVQPNVTFDVPDARAAFFPAYSTLVRLSDHVLPGHEVVAALFVNFVLGAVAVLLVGLIARRLYGDAIAEKSMVLMAMFPGAFVLSFAYSEALLIVVAAGCLLCLMDQRWLAAGVLAALGTAARPNGLALVAACAVAAFLAIRRDRAWRSLVAVVLAPVGFVAFQVWVGIHAGETGVWFRVQREAWKEGTSFGFTAISRSLKAFVHPLSSPTDVVTAASVVAMLILVWFLWKYRLPWPQIAYIAGVLALMLLPSTVTARPRFLYTAFPLFICAAAWLHHHGKEIWPYVIAACAAGLVGLAGLYGVLGAVP